MRPIAGTRTLAFTTLILGLGLGCARDDREPNLALARYETIPAEYTAVEYEQESTKPPVVVGYAQYVREPASFVGSIVHAETVVGEVISDRAFWLDAGEEGRVLAVVREDVPRQERIDIEAGQRIRFDALVMRSSAMTDLAGKLETDAERAISSTPAFLAMHWKDVTILGSP